MGWFHLFLVLTTVVVMEGFAWLMHKYVLHGWLWFLHRTHHNSTPRLWGVFEANDWIALAYGFISTAFIVWGSLHSSALMWVGIGISVYGLLYFLLHDVLVHQRVRLRMPVKHPYLRRLIRAHILHHQTHERTGAVAFGFLYALKKYGPKG